MADETFVRKSRSQMISYTRPESADYINANGERVSSPPNRIRLNHRESDGYLLGIKFGDGDSAHIPNEINNVWVDDDSAFTLIALGQAPAGEVWLRCGDIEIMGLGGHKLHIIEAPASTALGSRIELFPNSPTGVDAHLLTVKYYNKTDVFSGHPDEVGMMEELNTFTNGAWN